MCKNFLFIILNSFILIAIVDISITSTYFVPQARFYSDPIKPNRSGNAVECVSTLTIYGYCPGIIHAKFMNINDNFLPIYNHIDSEGRATYPKKNQRPDVTKKNTVFLLGDSFMQAEEMEIHERLEHKIRLLGYETVVYGYSSWNSIQFENIVKSIDFKRGDTVIIFSMLNDYTPNYGAATVNTKNNVLVNETPDKVNRKPLIIDYIGQSFLIRLMKDAWFNLINKDANHNTRPIKLSHDEHNTDFCYTIPSTFDAPSLIILDYIYLSKNRKCWNEEIKDSVDQNLNILTSIKNKMNNLGVNFEIYLVPPPWAFKNQNTIGRNNKLYQVQTNKKITTTGLLAYLSSRGLPINGLTNVLEKNSKKVDDLYFAVDGHWTPFAHELIFQHIKNRLFY